MSRRSYAAYSIWRNVKILIIANYSKKSNHNEVMLFLEGRLIRPRTVKNVLGVLSQDGEKGIDI